MIDTTLQTLSQLLTKAALPDLPPQQRLQPRWPTAHEDLRVVGNHGQYLVGSARRRGLEGPGPS